MFRTFIYVDENNLYSYMRQIGVTSVAKPKTETRSRHLSASIPFAGVSGSIDKSVNSEYVQDLGFDLDHFENALEKLAGEDYFDFVMNSDYNIFSIPPMRLIRLCCPFTIPEQFDIYNLIAQYKPIFLNSMGLEDEETQEREIIQAFFDNASADIPIVADFGDIQISAKLNVNNLLEDYTDLEEYDEQSVYMLCKVIGVTNKDKVQIFDPLKDFIHLNRSMRRQQGMSSKESNFEEIVIDGPVMKVEVIAMYK